MPSPRQPLAHSALHRSTATMYRPLMNSVDYNVINADDLGLKTRPGGASVWHSAFNIVRRARPRGAVRAARAKTPAPSCAAH